MALTNARDILNKKILGNGRSVPSADEIPIDVAGLSATKLSVGLEEIVLDINQLSSSVLTINNKIENMTSSDYIFRDVVVTSPSITINGDSILDIDTGTTIPDDEVLCGCASRYAGLPEFVLTNMYTTVVENVKHLKVTILNPTSSQHTSTGNISFICISKKETPAQSTRSTKKKSK